MTEVKTESQSTRITQTQPSIKRQPQLNGGSIAEPLDGESIVESTTEATPAKKRRTTKTEKAIDPTQKRQATSKTPNQSASTRVKLTWEGETSPSIEATLAQFNEQFNAIWAEISSLKTKGEPSSTLQAKLALLNQQLNTMRTEINELKAGSEPAESNLDRTTNHTIETTFAHFNHQISAHCTAFDELKATAEKPPTQPRPGTSHRVQLPLESPMPPHPAHSSPPERQQPRDVVRPSTVKSSTSIPPFRPTTSVSTVRSRRRKPLSRIMQQLLKLPERNSGIAIDAALWVLAAAGVRIGLNALISAMPILHIPVMLLIFVPPVLAGCTALFTPQANRIGIYRLLLVTLGLFVGGKL